MKRTNWKKIAYFAAEEAYRHEVVETQMKDLMIGEWMDYESEEDWVEQRVQEWILASQEA